MTTPLPGQVPAFSANSVKTGKPTGVSDAGLDVPESDQNELKDPPDELGPEALGEFLKPFIAVDNAGFHQATLRVIRS